MNRFRAIVPLSVLLVLLCAYLSALWVRSTKTLFQLETEVKVLGQATPVKLVAENPHGLRRISAVLEQDGKSWPLFEQAQPARRWSIFRNTELPQLIGFEAGAKKAGGLKDGKAVIRIEAVSNDLRAATERMLIAVEVNTKPPGLAVDEGELIGALGGSGVIAFTISGYVTESGVRVGRYVFPSFPMPGSQSAQRRIAIFAIPHDMEAGDGPIVFARNPTGTEATSRIRGNIARPKFRSRDIAVSAAFLNKIFSELDRGGAGNETARFVKINNDMRQQNNQQLAALSTKSASRPLWSGAFSQLANSSVEAQFCDYRNYLLGGQIVDRQVHLGFDLAVTARTPVTASNAGTVVHAAPLGIYGNAIVIDHGLGVQSLYAHLSDFMTTVGASVKKGDVIGKSGATGLAGGDHLHFAMLVGGVPVNPIEWWDAHWMADRYTLKIR